MFFGKVINAVHHGLPQNRRRLWVVGLKKDLMTCSLTAHIWICFTPMTLFTIKQGHFKWPLDNVPRVSLETVLDNQQCSGSSGLTV